jgi:hypothetical protein
VQKIIKSANTENLAKARLVQLTNEGIVKGLGVGRRDNTDIAFVAINEQFLNSDTSELSAIQGRLKEALQDIPFDILGHYEDTSSSIDAPSRAITLPVAAPQVDAQHEPLHAKNDGPLSSAHAPPQDYALAQNSPVPAGWLPGRRNETEHRPIHASPKAGHRASQSLTIVLLLAAVSGWGAFAYGVASGNQQQIASQDKIRSVTADRDKLNTDLNQARGEVELTRQALERAQADLASARAQLQASPPPTTRDEMRRVTADRDKLNAELNQLRAEAERNRLALERVQAELVSTRAQPQANSPLPAPQTPAPSPAPPVRPRPVR